MGKRPAEGELFGGNMGTIQREDSALYAKRRTANHGNRTRMNSSESSERTKAPVYIIGPSHREGESLGESMSDFERLGSRGGWTNSAGGEGELRGLD
jgi:hypothetical protein